MRNRIVPKGWVLAAALALAWGAPSWGVTFVSNNVQLDASAEGQIFGFSGTLSDEDSDSLSASDVPDFQGEVRASASIRDGGVVAGGSGRSTLDASVGPSSI